MTRSVSKIGYLAAILIAATYAFFTLRGPQGIPALMQKRMAIREMEKRNAELHREVEYKRQKINRLRENKSEQELQIRDQLNLVRPGEKVFIFQDPKSAAR
jgi:cell division protein FtsB